MNGLQIISSGNNIGTDVSQGLDFLLTHLKKPDWPRNVATELTKGSQITVYNEEDALKLYADANYINCRLAAYPYHNQQKPEQTKHRIIDFVMIDLDVNDFGSSWTKLNKVVLAKTLRNITKVFGPQFKPTVINSGNGYHILLPIEPIGYALEHKPEFAKFKNPSNELLRFIERYLSNNKYCSVHNSTVAFGNCMLRVPGSLNCKSVSKIHQVKVIKEWSNSHRACIEPLLSDFLFYLIDKENSRLAKLVAASNVTKNSSSTALTTKIIDWIEILLNKPIADYRKYCIWRILAPYLITKRKLDSNNAQLMIKHWIAKCSELEPIDFDEDYKIQEGLDSVESKGCYPITFADLKNECPELHSIIWSAVKEGGVAI
jgi:hypothetical protein